MILPQRGHPAARFSECHVLLRFYMGLVDTGSQNSCFSGQNSTCSHGFIRVLGDPGVIFSDFWNLGKVFQGSRNSMYLRNFFQNNMIPWGNSQALPHRTPVI